MDALEADNEEEIPCHYEKIIIKKKSDWKL